MIKTILTDIEGTTSAISFVKDTLFPYAYERVEPFVKMFGADPIIRQIINEAKMAAGDVTMSDDAIIAQFREWIDEDRKVTPLKTLQGLIWAHGYKSGAYQAHMYPDATPNLKAWKDKGKKLAVYSSGSVKAQELFFTFSQDGNIADLFSAFFDTTTGHKQEPHSYKRIAKSLQTKPEEILFLSDVIAELDAAKQSGLQTCLVCRDEKIESEHDVVSSFDDIVIEADK